MPYIFRHRISVRSPDVAPSDQDRKLEWAKKRYVEGAIGVDDLEEKVQAILEDPWDPTRYAATGWF